MKFAPNLEKASSVSQKVIRLEWSCSARRFETGYEAGGLCAAIHNGFSNPARRGDGSSVDTCMRPVTGLCGRVISWGDFLSFAASCSNVSNAQEAEFA